MRARVAPGLAPRARARAPKLGEDAIRESFLRLAPVTGLDLTKGVTSNHARHHSHLNRENVLPVRRSTRVDPGRLANYKRGRGGKQAGLCLRVRDRHVAEAPSDMNVCALMQRGR